MSTLVDTSVWSMALRRDHPPNLPELGELKRSLASGSVLCTGLILQELLQGFSKPKAHRQIIDRFSSLPFIVPNREDHIDAAELRMKCRQRGVQAGTVDALLAQLCIRHELIMLTMDKDFQSMSRIVPLVVWTA